MPATPQTAAPIYFFMDPASRFVTWNTPIVNNILQVYSIQNRAGANGPVVQTTSTAQPGWAGNAIDGTFYWEVQPGGGIAPTSTTPGTSALVGTAGLTFNGSSQFLEYDELTETWLTGEGTSPAQTFSGAEVGITVSCVVQLGSAPNATNTIWSLGSTSGTQLLTLNITSGGTLQLQETNAAGGPTTASISSVSTNLSVVTATRTSGTLSLRVWNTTNTTTNQGVTIQGLATMQTSSTTFTTSTETFNTFCIGAAKTNSTSATLFFDGNIGKLLVYGVSSGTTSADIEVVEADLLLSAGMSRLTDLATSTGSVEVA